MSDVTTVCAASDPPYVRLLTADCHYLESEPITILLHPASAAAFEVRITGSRRAEVLRRRLSLNRLELKSGLPVGRYQVRARWAAATAPDEQQWSNWSIRCPIEVHSSSPLASSKGL